MLVIGPKELPAPEAEVRAALKSYQDAVIAHAATVDVPAPLPAYELIYRILAAGGEFVVETKPGPPPVPVPTTGEAVVAAIATDPKALADLRKALKLDDKE